jgi:hypothetical protein
MSRQKLFASAVVAAFLLILLPAPSEASSRNWTLFSEPAAGLFAKIERWWNSILNGTERPEPVQEKNGCGLDPNGQMVCKPDPNGPGSTTGPGG